MWRYELRWSPDARDHLADLPAHQRVTVVDAAERQLVAQPNRATRNRKLLWENPLATWELRAGRVRVFYNINDADGAVEIVKEHNRLFIGGEEMNCEKRMHR